MGMAEAYIEKYLDQTYGHDDSRIVRVIPEHWPAWLVFRRVQNQWLSNMGGPYALDYNIVFHVMEAMDTPKEDKLRLLDMVRLIERGALDAMAEKRNQH